MSTLETQIMEIVARIDEDRQRRVLELAQQLEAETKPSTDQWLEEAATFRAKLRAKYGENHSFHIQETLDEIREERLNDPTGRD